MFFIISKILFFLITPIIWVIVLFAIALFVKKPNVRKRFLIIGLFVFLLFTNNYIFTIIAQNWEIEPIKPSKIIEKYEYGIVLGGMSSVNPKSGVIQYASSIDRLLKAIELYKRGTIKKIVITGGSGLLLNPKQKEATDLKETCIMLGIMDTDLILEPNSKNTRETALFTKKLIGIPNSKILLITSGFHMRRSEGCFKKVGFKLDVFATDPIVPSRIDPDDYFLPKTDPLGKWTMLFKEWIGYVSYKLAGYI